MLDWLDSTTPQEEKTPPGADERQTPDLETRIRTMAARWGYSGDELESALADSRANPDGWRQVVEFDEAQAANILGREGRC